MFLATLSMLGAALLAFLLETSISLDFNALINVAFNIINSLWPLFAVPIGFLFGLRLIAWIMDEIRSAVPGGR